MAGGGEVMGRARVQVRSHAVTGLGFGESTHDCAGQGMGVRARASWPHRCDTLRVTAMHLELSELGKTYDDQHWAVRDISLEVPSGTIVGLIGPNGAGKSTTLRMLATVQPPSCGRITFDHQPPAADLSPLRRQIGFLGDGHPLYQDMTPVDYLRFFGRCFKLAGPALETAIEDVLTLFNLRDRANTPSRALSKGMRQRLLIARCLLHQPRLLLLDEPADGLDPRGRTELRSALLRARERGVTILISSHILRELDDLCDQMVILQQGRVVVAGPVGEIIERYDVQRFVYQLRLLAGGAEARALLANRRALIVGEGVEDGCELLSIQVLGGEALMADLLAELVAANVRVVTVSRIRSRIEDVYDRLAEDRVA